MTTVVFGILEKFFVFFFILEMFVTVVITLVSRFEKGTNLNSISVFAFGDIKIRKKLLISCFGYVELCQQSVFV